MTTSQITPYLSEILSSERIPEDRLAYFRSRLRSRLHSFVLAQFQIAERERGFTKADLARKLDRDAAQITRWLAAPRNWEFDTFSDLLLGMGLEPRFSASSLALGPILPAQEDWRKSGDELAPRPLNLDESASNDWFGDRQITSDNRQSKLDLLARAA